MAKYQKTGRLIFGILFIGSLLAYSAVNAWEARGELEAEWESFQIWDLKDDIPDMNGAMEEHVWHRYDFVEAYGMIQLLMGKNEENSFENVKDKRGYLYKGNFWSGFGVDQKMLAGRTRRLMDAMARKGTEVGFVLCPEKLVPEEAGFRGIPYDSFEVLGNDILRWMDYYGVPYLDLRDTLRGSGLAYEDIWFRTDHHWTPRAAFEGYRGVVGWMNEEFQAGLDEDGIAREIGNYEQIYYQNAMLGSQGRDAGIIYSGGMEDYTALFPKEPGTYRWEFDNGGKREGTFRQAFLNEDIVGIDPYETNAGKYYLYEVTRYSRQINSSAEDGKKILIVRDSFASPVGAFLIQNFGQVDMLWGIKYSPEEFAAYLEENSYDYILVMLYPNNLTDEAFPFGMEKKTDGTAQ